MHVAEASLFIVVSRVLWGFDIGPKEGCPLDMDAKTGKWLHFWSVNLVGYKPGIVVRLMIPILIPVLRYKAILINKPKPYEVEIVCRGEAYRKVIEDSASRGVATGILDLDNVVAPGS